MAQPNRLFAAVALAGALALTSCNSSAGMNAKSNSNVTILAKGPNGRPTEVKIDGKDWAVCSKAAEKHCIDPVPAGLA